MFRIGLLLGFSAVLLQIAVFLQPLLPAQFQIAPVCETITRALYQADATVQHSHSHGLAHQHASSDHNSKPIDAAHQLQSHHASGHGDHHHDVNHQCQYCTVFGNLVLPPELHVKEVLVRIQVRLIAFQKAFKHIYFVLQRLFLLPQGRAPPQFA